MSWAAPGIRWPSHPSPPSTAAVSFQPVGARESPSEGSIPHRFNGCTSLMTQSFNQAVGGWANLGNRRNFEGNLGKGSGIAFFSEIGAIETYGSGRFGAREPRIDPPFFFRLQ